MKASEEGVGKRITKNEKKKTPRSLDIFCVSPLQGSEQRASLWEHELIASWGYAGIVNQKNKEPGQGMCNLFIPSELILSTEYAIPKNLLFVKFS